MGKLSWREPTGQHSENSWKTIANPVLNGYTKPEITGKHSEKRIKQQPAETKRILNTKIQARWGPSFYIWLGRGAVRTLPPVSYATDQVHFKHEQPQVLLIESHVESVRFNKRRTQPACSEYNDTIVGMRLDQPSYWDSWKLVGRFWRYHQESWIKLNFVNNN